jgi:hypothetical protein
MISFRESSSIVQSSLQFTPDALIDDKLRQFISFLCAYRKERKPGLSFLYRYPYDSVAHPEYATLFLTTNVLNAYPGGFVQEPW